MKFPKTLLDQWIKQNKEQIKYMKKVVIRSSNILVQCTLKSPIVASTP